MGGGLRLNLRVGIREGDHMPPPNLNHLSLLSPRLLWYHHSCFDVNAPCFTYSLKCFVFLSVVGETNTAGPTTPA